jgi:SSS family solute:Na+ symporter
LGVSILAAIVAPALDNFTSIFSYIQEFQGFISPGILAVFILGFFSPKTPRFFGVVGIVTNVVAYGALKWFIGPLLTANDLWYSDEIAFLDRMAICFFLVMTVGLVLTKLFPLNNPVEMPENKTISMETSKGAKMAGIGIIIATICLYIAFW